MPAVFEAAKILNNGRRYVTITLTMLRNYCQNEVFKHQHYE